MKWLKWQEPCNKVKREKAKRKRFMEKPARGRNIVERTFEFAVEIVKLADKISKRSWIGKKLASQVLDAGTSIGANVEEAQAAESKADFTHKYNIALKEARETKFWLSLLAAVKVSGGDGIETLKIEADEISRIIAKIVINTRK
jgi:four helix bundle protein